MSLWQRLDSFIRLHIRISKHFFSFSYSSSIRGAMVENNLLYLLFFFKYLLLYLFFILPSSPHPLPSNPSLTLSHFPVSSVSLFTHFLRLMFSLFIVLVSLSLSLSLYSSFVIKPKENINLITVLD